MHGLSTSMSSCLSWYQATTFDVTFIFGVTDVKNSWYWDGFKFSTTELGRIDSMRVSSNRTEKLWCFISWVPVFQSIQFCEMRNLLLSKQITSYLGLSFSFVHLCIQCIGFRRANSTLLETFSKFLWDKLSKDPCHLLRDVIRDTEAHADLILRSGWM